MSGQHGCPGNMGVAGWYQSLCITHISEELPWWQARHHEDAFNDYVQGSQQLAITQAWLTGTQRRFLDTIRQVTPVR